MQAPQGFGVFGAVRLFQSGGHARHDGHGSHEGLSDFGAQSVLAKVIGAESIGFGQAQSQVEETHGDYLTHPGIGYAYEYANGFFNLLQPALFCRNLLRSY